MPKALGAQPTLRVKTTEPATNNFRESGRSCGPSSMPDEGFLSRSRSPREYSNAADVLPPSFQTVQAESCPSR